jgi:hypothetical protein
MSEDHLFVGIGVVPNVDAGTNVEVDTGPVDQEPVNRDTCLVFDDVISFDVVL